MEPTWILCNEPQDPIVMLNASTGGATYWWCDGVLHITVRHPTDYAVPDILNIATPMHAPQFAVLVRIMTGNKYTLRSHSMPLDTLEQWTDKKPTRDL